MFSLYCNKSVGMGAVYNYISSIMKQPTFKETIDRNKDNKQLSNKLILQMLEISKRLPFRMKEDYGTKQNKTRRQYEILKKLED